MKFLVIVLCMGWILPLHAKDAITDKIDCLEDSFTQIDLQDVCPEVFHTLQQHGLTTVLETPLLNQLSQRQLRMLQNALPSSNQTIFLNDSGLDSLLAGIYVDKNKNHEDSWWKQFLDWLNRSKPERYEAEFNWLVDFMDAITPSAVTVQFIIYSLFGLILIVALGLLVRELYLARIFDRKKDKTKDNNPLNITIAENFKPTLSAAEIKQLPPTVQIISLLKNVIAHLTHNESLPDNEALTNCELKRYLQQYQSPSATPFSKLLADVEPVLYGNEIPTEQLLENCWRHTEQIIKS